MSSPTVHTLEHSPQQFLLLDTYFLYTSEKFNFPSVNFSLANAKGTELVV
ncbi:hypothetical protein SAMN05421858_3378 [Haladaptatus litoreus]|uniref:Uncharacterized protein n=1 Tax=Haladaptatus litoreus TaxID=553468 RepID=A0A1N7D0C5_9EURY|nr:hypothetical protein SAMN05421858_3378 [Haladaptatus litoreus]